MSGWSRDNRAARYSSHRATTAGTSSVTKSMNDACSASRARAGDDVLISEKPSRSSADHRFITWIRISSSSLHTSSGIR